MHKWLGRMPWAFTWLFVLGTALGAPPSADQLRCWICQLGADDFAVRAEASGNLLAAGDSAVESLLASACNSAPEAASQAGSVLMQLALVSDEQTLHRVIAGLEQVADRRKPALENMTKELRTRQARLQRERAVATIRSLGGKFAGDEKLSLNLAPLAQDARAEETAIEPPPETSASETSAPKASDQIISTADQLLPMGVGFIADAYVSPEFADGSETNDSELIITIDENWRGGDTGLAALLELGSIEKLRLHQAPLTDAALDQIAALQLPVLDIEGCRFSAAALAKLRQCLPQAKVLVDGK